ncbi:hypothetical protein Pmar_PMAR003260 [Perkinsus marinus ATCC 50983]|uniref:Uncharacterized protein n=1 Tax=Perkinsus marinus (strain ATCC 50983 / TXsc) TaxID=423536 RepID=C5L5P4_PERM5|nr:hypothetical protein Pmar_PMAR003260 [Perkinsus marinus ATCC 50983]EER07941.1 hypothetical protein Pmar_PMAR003260 [Perkinsus marinus ATCC 50983]|eukprot:XP_002776125.1 hypothetical protein Pmar_PMAR003260 [Perkinsus marinus ATCC 50983]
MAEGRRIDGQIDQLRSDLEARIDEGVASLKLEIQTAMVAHDRVSVAVGSELSGVDESLSSREKESSVGDDHPQVEEVSELPGHNMGVSDIAVNSVGTRTSLLSRNIPAVGGKTIDIGDIDHIAILTREAGRYNVLISVGSAGGKIHFTDLATDASSDTGGRGTKRPVRRLIPPVDCLYRGAKKTYLGCVTAMQLSEDGSYLAYGTSSGYVGVARLVCDVEESSLRLECELRGVLRCFKSAISSPVRCLATHGDTLLVGGEANVGRIMAIDMSRVSGYLVDESGERSSGSKSRKTRNPAILGSIPLNYTCRLRAILVSESQGHLQHPSFLLSLVSSDGIVQSHELPQGPEGWADDQPEPSTVNFLDLRSAGTLKLSPVTICGVATAALKTPPAAASWHDCAIVALPNGSIEIYQQRECSPPNMPELPIEVEGGVFDMFKSAASQHRQLNVAENWNQELLTKHYEEPPPATTAATQGGNATRPDDVEMEGVDGGKPSGPVEAAGPSSPLITSTQPMVGS